MLTIISTHEMYLSKTQMRRQWNEFFNGHVITHSSNAQTLPWLIRKCEQEKVPYRLDAVPGYGYTIQKIEETPRFKEAMS